MYSKFINYLPSDHLIGKFSLFMSIMALFFAVSLSGDGMGCLNAEECNVGDSESFSNNIRVYTNGTHYHEITGDTNNQNTQDHVLKLPNVTGTLLASSMSFGNDQYIKTNAQGEIISDDLPALDIDDDSKIDISGITSGKFLQTTGTGLNFVDVDINETTFDSSSGSEGQILQISGGSLTFQDMSGGGGSFQATANQNLVAGTVGIESDGSISNITTLQDGTSAFSLSESQVQTTKPNVLQLNSFYNSNIDAQVIFYRDYDSNNDATCDTHTYVDVVEHDGTNLTKWGRECVSNEWSNHTGNYPNQVASSQTLAQTTNQNMIVRRYGRESDESIDDYVLLYFGQQQQDGQVWGIPVSIDSANSTIIVGTEALIHDENTCYSNGSCPGTQSTYDINIFNDMAFASGQDNKMYFWWNQYHGSSSNASYYLSHKSFTCSNLGQANASCSPDNNYKRTSSTSYLKQYNQANYPEIVWDHTAQTWMAMNHYDSYNWKITQFSLQEGVNNVMNFGSYGSNAPTVFTTGGSYTDNTNGVTFGVNSPYGCVAGYNNEQAFYDEDADVWIFPCYYASAYNNYDTYGTAFIIVSANTSNATGVVTIHDYWSSQYAVGIDPNSSNGCSGLPNFECKDRVTNTNFGATFYDTTDHIHYWYTPKHQKNGGCIDEYASRCMAVWQWEIDPTTKGVDNSTFREFTYQNSDGTKYYNHTKENFNFIYKDKSENVLIGGFHYGDQSASDKYKLFTQAFVIPDNISEWIGYVNQSYNQGATVTVYSVGAVIDGLSGLTIGQEYFVQDAGTIGTSGTYKIGRAIATDKIYVTNTR